MNHKELFISIAIFLYMGMNMWAQEPWVLQGNAVTSQSKLGTTNGFSLNFFSNNQQRMQLSAGGNFGIGTNASSYWRTYIHSTLGVPTFPGEEGSPQPPGTTQNTLQMTNTESGTGPLDGLRFGLVGYKIYYGTTDNLNVRLYSKNSSIELLNSGNKIQFFGTTGLNNSASMEVNVPDNINGMCIKGSYSNTGFALRLNSTNNSGNALEISNGSNIHTVINNNGQVGIGTAILDPFYKLEVAGKIRACEVRVNNPGWCDYVFEPNYLLMPLPELRSFITTQKHLPEIPSTGMVENEGIELGEMNALLLKKIEELTLYILQLEERLIEVETSCKE